MRRTALHEYLSQIEGLLDDNRLPEAAAHCHFVLQQFPRHIGTYRLFGRALLEQQLYDEAIDVFERLLSADPEDLISHAGLALAYSESRDLERAIWHMERAYDIDPYNRAIQDELRKMYIGRDGDGPTRLSLTRAALARLQFKAALFRQATAELSELVAENPERLDLQLALADTLYWDSRPVEAAELCLKILERLPFCIKANAILADAWLRGERVDEAREHLRRVQALTLLDRAHLDPDTTLGRALGNPRIQIPESVQVEVLEDTLAFARGFEETGSFPEQTTAVVIDGEQVPDWLLEIGSPQVETAVDAPGESLSELEPEEVMEWLDEAAAAEMVDAVAEAEAEPLPEPVVPEAVELEQPSFEAEEQVEEDDERTPDEESVAEELLTAVTAAEALDEFRDEGIDDLSGGVADEALPGSEISDPQSDIGGSGDELYSAMAIDHARPDDSAYVQGEDAQDAAAAIWDDESLLALDDLRAYIEADSESGTANSEAPEWLGELTDGSEVADELPDWLYEAVGLEPAQQSVGDHLESAAPHEGDDEFDGDLLSVPGTEEDGGRIGKEHDQALMDLEGELSALSFDDDVPDWLVEGDDVLEDLPAGLLAADESGRMEERGLEEDTRTWLDELAEQLAASNDDPLGLTNTAAGETNDTSPGASLDASDDALAVEQGE